MTLANVMIFASSNRPPCALLRNLFCDGTTPRKPTEDINRRRKSFAHRHAIAWLDSPCDGLEGSMAGDSIVFWLCAAGATLGLLIRLMSQLQLAGIL